MLSVDLALALSVSWLSRAGRVSAWMIPSCEVFEACWDRTGVEVGWGDDNSYSSKPS